MKAIRDEEAQVYQFGPLKPDSNEYIERDDAVITEALQLLELRLKNRTYDALVMCPEDAVNYLKLKYAAQDREYFVCIYLNTKNAIIEVEEHSVGTLTRSGVYPRDIIKKALMVNASGLILAHNHPSGGTMPSEADKKVTANIQEAGKLFDVRVLDHVIVGEGKGFSFASAGLM